MNVEILNPDTTLFVGEADVVTLPGSEGTMQILNDHAPMIAALAKGVVVIKKDNKEQSFEIIGGVAEVLKNKVIILA